MPDRYDQQPIYPGIRSESAPNSSEGAAISPYQSVVSDQNATLTTASVNDTSTSLEPVTLEPVSKKQEASIAGISLASLGEIKGLIDRVGGIDGIVSGISKVQKLVSSFQQLGPVAKIVMSVLPFGKGKLNSVDTDAVALEPRPNKQKKKSSNRKKTSSSTSRKSKK